MATAVSAMRVEKPHSLSYQLSTRRQPPSTTWVCGRATVEEAAMWLKSMETSGSLVHRQDALQRARSAAACMAALISSTVTVAAGTNVRSTTETLGVGTRIEEPSSLPFSSGQHQAQRLGRAGGGRDHRHGRGAGRGRGPCASCPASAGRRCRSGWWSCSRARCRTGRCSTLATGARQLVVQEPLETTRSSAVRRLVVDAVDDGLVGVRRRAPRSSTRLAPASRWAAALSRAVKRPVHSSAMSTPRSLCGSSAGSRIGGDLDLAQARRRSSRSPVVTVPGKRPCTLS